MGGSVVAVVPTVVAFAEVVGDWDGASVDAGAAVDGIAIAIVVGAVAGARTAAMVGVTAGVGAMAVGSDVVGVGVAGIVASGVPLGDVGSAALSSGGAAPPAGTAAGVAFAWGAPRPVPRA